MKTLILFIIIVIISLLVFASLFLAQVYFTNSNNIFIISFISIIPSILSILTLTELLYKFK
jgi:Ca2+/H+ antiporter